ncbi:MAG: type II CAAX prenyl endopeptidase Rce1 family protein [Bacteroidota bacterium]|nr:CPBP family intramembrane metalloprotease [Cytophagales bacterium]MCE2955827.1 CPBP family intramembrane metalloprotease [Flammeovirgaceae bacterium]MCZ8069490.1 CPBP family intramembrane metalloprotease [Cytophagales bacterium]
MEEFEKRPVWLVLLVVILSAFVGTLIGLKFGAEIGSIFYREEGDFLTKFQSGVIEASMKIPVLIMQGISALCGLFLAPFFTYRAMTKKGIKSLSINRLDMGLLLFSLLIVVFFAIVDSAIIEWNKNITFPNFLNSFESWARKNENQLEEITKMFTTLDGLGEFAIAFLVIAVGAGVCEEFLFRGIIQTELFRATKNIHFAIWLSAFLFSAIHVQFFGFFPRLLLGALFGYLYHWSGNLIVPMFAHLVNNGFSLFAIYLFQHKTVSLDLENQVAPWYLILFSLIMLSCLLFFFKRKSDELKTSVS